VNLLVDTVMPVMFAAATTLVVARAAPRRLGLHVVPPAAFLVLDVMENMAFLTMLRQYPDVSPALVAATSPVTVIKLSAFVLAFPTLIIGAVVLGVRWLRRDRRGLPRNRA
jgi:hypothetical protein